MLEEYGGNRFRILCKRSRGCQQLFVTSLGRSELMCEARCFEADRGCDTMDRRDLGSKLGTSFRLDATGFSLLAQGTGFGADQSCQIAQLRCEICESLDTGCRKFIPIVLSQATHANELFVLNVFSDHVDSPLLKLLMVYGFFASK